MSTSDRTVVAEAAGAAALVLGGVALASPGDVWMHGLGLHPLWLPVIVLAARYSTRGLFPALLFTIGGLLGASVGLEGVDGSMAGFGMRARNPSDIIALATAVMVAWVAMAHESRIARADRRLAEATAAQAQAEQSVQALHASLGYLRGRHDRLDVSLSLWRNLAGRLERGNASEASRAVLELCEIRAGSRAGIVQLLDGARLTTLATRGQWPATSIRGGELERDATVRAAIASGHVTPAGPGATLTDSDVAVPVTDEDTGMVIGVIALRGVSPGTMRAAELRDLGVLARWLAPAVTRQLRRKFGQAVHDLQSLPRKKTQVLP
jgi:hypothetical protein